MAQPTNLQQHTLLPVNRVAAVYWDSNRKSVFHASDGVRLQEQQHDIRTLAQRIALPDLL